MEKQITPESFASQIFVVEKKDGGLRPVVNLGGLNQYVRAEHFKMEGLHLLPDLLLSGDWMAKLDLKDAYLNAHSSEPSTSPHVSMEGQILHVHMLAIWSISSTEGLHEHFEANSGLPTAGRVPSDNITR